MWYEFMHRNSLIYNNYVDFMVECVYMFMIYLHSFCAMMSIYSNSNVLTHWCPAFSIKYLWPKFQF